jgi:hypothetical protein
VFSYTGCKGNGNNFASKEECLAVCDKSMRMHRLKHFYQHHLIDARNIVAAVTTLDRSREVCQHPIEGGTCDGNFERYAYDIIANDCRSFFYGGCEGNGNNFATIAECREQCVRNG